MVKDNPEFTLEEYAGKYANAKNEEKIIKKEVELLNNRLKELMKDGDITEVSSGNITVHYSVQHRQSFNEDKLIAQLKHFAPDSNCIKTKEYIDMDVLEDEIYKGLLSSDALCAMDTCRVDKEVEVLTISKRRN